jgi:hypothetical protein
LKGAVNHYEIKKKILLFPYNPPHGVGPARIRSSTFLEQYLFKERSQSLSLSLSLSLSVFLSLYLSFNLSLWSLNLSLSLSPEHLSKSVTNVTHEPSIITLV